MPHYDFRRTRVFVTEDLTEETVFPANPSQANYLLRVLRKAEGDLIQVFNGRDGEWLAEIVNVHKRDCALRLTERIRAQPPEPDLVCCFAPLKKARMDYLVQKCVEMGAGVLQPVLTEFTQVERVKLERMEANVIEAAEQCGVLHLPKVRKPVTLRALLEAWEPDRALVFCDEAAPVGDPVPVLRGLDRTRFGFLVGPEGGFSDAERQLLLGLPHVAVIALGPRILRADTALVAGLAALQIAVGDWTDQNS